MKKDMRVQLVMSKAELNRLDTWRKTQGALSRSEAIRRFVAQGIAREEKRATHQKRAAAARVRKANVKAKRKSR